MKQFFVFVVFILMAVAGYFWFNPTEQIQVQLIDEELLPDYIAQDITRIVFDEQGYRTDFITASKLEHFELLGFTQFEFPIYILFDQGHTATWQVSSQSAAWFPDDRLILERQVNIVNLLQDELIERIETEELELIFPDKTLQTNLPVVFKGNGFYIEGIGMQADLEQKILKIQQHKETVYLNEN